MLFFGVELFLDFSQNIMGHSFIFRYLQTFCIKNSLAAELIRKKSQQQCDFS